MQDSISKYYILAYENDDIIGYNSVSTLEELRESKLITSVDNLDFSFRIITSKLNIHGHFYNESILNKIITRVLIINIDNFIIDYDKILPDNIIRMDYNNMFHVLERHMRREVGINKLI